MFICDDLAVPETVRTFALQGATIAALTTGLPMKDEDPEADGDGDTDDIQTATTVDLREGLERGRTLDFFGLNLLQDRRPEFYGIVADKGVYYQSEVAPLVRQSFAPPTHEREEAPIREREFVAGD